MINNSSKITRESNDHGQKHTKEDNNRDQDGESNDHDRQHKRRRHKIFTKSLFFWVRLWMCLGVSHKFSLHTMPPRNHSQCLNSSRVLMCLVTNLATLKIIVSKTNNGSLVFKHSMEKILQTSNFHQMHDICGWKRVAFLVHFQQKRMFCNCCQM